jgi:hypothetical protein
MATELVKPTSTATKPAVAAERLKSRQNCISKSELQTPDSQAPKAKKT